MAAPPPIPSLPKPPRPAQPPAAIQALTMGRIVYYAFPNPLNGGCIKRPAIIVRVGPDQQLGLSVLIDGALDIPMLPEKERDPVVPRAAVWRHLVPPSQSGQPEAMTWRWPPRAP